MEIKKNKELYDAPSTIVFEVKTEGVICASGSVNATMNGTWDEEDI